MKDFCSFATCITIQKGQVDFTDYVLGSLGTYASLNRNDVFEVNQAGVMLSRCRSLRGLHLSNYSPESIVIDEDAKKLEKIWTY